MRISADLDPRRKRILYRAWHRGTKEMDLVLGAFADARIADLDDAALDQFETLMTSVDPQTYKWLSGTADVPAEWDSPLVQSIREYHRSGEALQ